MKMFSQRDLDNLADILWWIKGYHAGATEAYENCPFEKEHMESLRVARVHMQNVLKARKDKTKEGE